jgi:hypothetical protein
MYSILDKGGSVQEIPKGRQGKLKSALFNKIDRNLLDLRVFLFTLTLILANTNDS